MSGRKPLQDAKINSMCMSSEGSRKSTLEVLSNL